AKSLPGVIAVWTADDVPEVAGGLSDWGPEDMESRGRPILTGDQVNYVGEAFALVVAESAYQAQDAAEAVIAEMDPLPGVGDVISATASGAPKVHADTKSNIARRKTTSYGDIKGAFKADSVTAKIRLTTARVAGAAMEPRAVTAAPDSETDGLEVWVSTQNVFGVREAIAGALEVNEEKVRVLAEDVGGGFGAKGMVFAEEVLIAVVASRLKRPAQWVASRSEDGATTAQGHGSVIELEIAAGRRGLVYDSGDYPRLLELTVEKLGSPPDPGDGRLVGVGIACCVESTGFGRGEPARIRIQKDGNAFLYVGSTPQGQGHQTMAA